MQNRFLFWLFCCASALLAPLHAQAPAGATPPSSPSSLGPGQIEVAQVRGSAFKTVNDVRTALAASMRIEQGARINTEQGASVVLVFSNGASTQLGEDTELIVDEFLQEPFARNVTAADLEEPTASKTRLSLNKGELVGKVTKLKHDRGSSFTVQTPVGAAGIRGTTFRIVFRPQGTGFAFFELSTAEGDVQFSPGGQGAGPDGQPPPGSGPAVSVTGGQQVVIQVSVTVTPTGRVIVTIPPRVISSGPISPATQVQLMAQAQSLAVAAALSSFTSPPGAPGAPGEPGGSGGPGGAGGPGAPVAPDGPGGPDGSGLNDLRSPPPTAPAPPRVTPGDGLP